MRHLLLVAVVAILACAGCGTLGPTREAATVHVQNSRRGGYSLVSDDDHETISEREFARMYKARTNSSELDATDHPHVKLTIVGLVASSVAFAFAGLTLADCPRCTGDIVGTSLLGTASPEEHDVPRGRAAVLVDQYNAHPR